MYSRKRIDHWISITRNTRDDGSDYKSNQFQLIQINLLMDIRDLLIDLYNRDADEKIEYEQD